MQLPFNNERNIKRSGDLWIAILFFLLSGNLWAQGGNTCALAQANPITSLPFTANGSTCNAGNNINNLSPGCISNIYTTGPDYFYYFCATQTGPIAINLSNLNPAIAYQSVSVYTGCPTATNCVAGSIGTGVMFNAVANQCYFIMMDNWPTPNCYSYTINIQAVQPPTCNSQCINADFENGGFSGWYGTSGTISTSTPPAPTPIYTMTSVGMPSAQHTIMTGANLDACGGFPEVFPGGNYSVMLGNGQTTGYGGGSIEQTFVVSPTTASFSYHYAVVVQDASHTNQEQPFFRVDVFDATNNPIACGNYLVVGGPNIPGFFPAACSFQTYYRPWTTASIDLSAYIGQCVTVRFTVGDCSQGGHFGYAYIDASCAPMQLLGADTICVGQSTTITAPSGAASYQWSTGATSQSITVSPTTTTIYSVTMVSVSGPNCLTVLQDTIYVLPGPLASFTYTGGGNCSGGTVTFTNTSQNGITYTWDFGDGSPLNNSSSPSHNYTGPGPFTVTLIATGGGCSDTIQQVVTLGSGVVAAFQASSACFGLPIQFTDQSTGGPTAWAWNFGDPGSGPNNTATVQNPTHIFSNSGQFTVTLIVFASNPLCNDTIQVLVNVDPPPTAAFVAPNGCVSTAISFTDQSVGGGSYMWDFGDNSPTSIQQNPVHAYAQSGQFTVTLIVLSSSGCPDTVQNVITIYPTPTVSFLSNTVCVGTPTLFTDQSTIQSGSISTWVWDFGDGSPLDASQNPQHIYAAAGAYTVVLTITSDQGCTSSSTALAFVSSPPVPAFQTSAVCVNSITTFTDLSTTTIGSITQWSWVFGDPNSGPLNNSSLQNPTHLYSSAGTYQVTLVVTNSAGCIDSITQTITVNPLPQAMLTADDTMGCQPHCVNFSDLSTIVTGSVSAWQWIFGDGGTSIQQNPSHCYADTGSFTVSLIVTSGDGCMDTLVIPNYIDVYPKPVAEFSMTPNPATIIESNIQFTDLSTGAPISWWWDFGDASLGDSIQHPQHFYNVDNSGIHSFLITLIIENQYGCLDTVQHELLIYPEFTFYAPNCVTPNGDGTNDFFHTYGIGWKEYELFIFDRWGDLIWKTTNPQQGWDARVQGGSSGQEVQEDVYVWKVKLTDVFDKKHTYVGHVSVIR